MKVIQTTFLGTMFEFQCIFNIKDCVMFDIYRQLFDSPARSRFDMKVLKSQPYMQKPIFPIVNRSITRVAFKLNIGTVIKEIHNKRT